MNQSHTDPFDALETALSRKRSGWHWHVNSQNGATVIFPREAKDVAAWEKRCLDMHSCQTTVMPDAKPARQSILGGIKRTVQVIDDPIPNFADLPETQRRALLKRGD